MSTDERIVEVKAAIVRVLRENGLTDEPEKYDGDIHSWRCTYPDRYGHCSCFKDLADDLADAVTDAVTQDGKKT